MRRWQPNLAFLAMSSMLVLAHCDGCREECSRLGQRAEGCSCQADQDCNAAGVVLMCAEGTCRAGEPPDVHGTVVCDTDTECGADEACAADGTCQPAPACQRLEPSGELSTLSEAGPGAASSGTATVASADAPGAPQASCGFTLDVAAPTFSITGWLDRDGELSSDDCEGRWFAAHRAGFVQCDGTLVALSAPDVTLCLGADCTQGSCRPLGDGRMGVCP